jgi:transposase
MSEYIAFDSHKRYTLMEREDAASGHCRQRRIEHRRGAIRAALAGCELGTPVAVEATGNWYWIVDEIEQAGLVPRLVHPRKAKLMMGCINKTDKLDVHGLNVLQRNGTLPTVWIPPGSLRDLRELTRTRMVLSSHRTRLKNRILATLTKYALQPAGYSDPFGCKARAALDEHVAQLPPETRLVTEMLLEQLDFTEVQIQRLETRLRALVKATPDMELSMTTPGIGVILATVIVLEAGDIERFADAEHFAAYAGRVPRVHASGDKVRFGRSRPDVNRYLKWAFGEAANSVALNHERCPDRHVSRLYLRTKRRRGYPKAIGAVARHLAEAVFHVLRRQEPYQEPRRKGQRGRTRKA